jgi:hypothetical protein
MLRANIPQARQILRKVLRSRIVLRPEERDRVDGCGLAADASRTGLVEGFFGIAVSVASPAEFVPETRITESESSV